MNRTEAKMVAEELAKLMRNEIRKMTIDLVVADTEGYMTLGEAAEFMGLSKHTVYKKIDEIPHVKFGKFLRFQKSELKKYING